MRRRFNLILVVIFYILLWLPLLEMKLNERQQTHFPAINKSLSRYIIAIESYFNENFGFRSQLIQTDSLLMVNLFNSSPNPQVILGKEGWLFYKSENADDGPGINDYEGKTPFSERDLARIDERVKSLNDWMAGQNMLLILLIAPNKQTIYGEYLPDYIRQQKGSSRYDQVKETLKNNPVKFIDTVSLLQQAKKDNVLYRKTDSHWNNYGGFLVYQNIIQLVQTGYQVKVETIKDFDVTVVQKTDSGDLARMIGLQNYFQEKNIVFVPKVPVNIIRDNYAYPTLYYNIKNVIPETSLPKLLVFHDSFFTAIEPFLSRHFSSSIYIWADLDTKIIEKEKPDIVIWEVAERYINKLLDDSK